MRSLNFGMKPCGKRIHYALLNSLVGSTYKDVVWPQTMKKLIKTQFKELNIARELQQILCNLTLSHTKLLAFQRL